MGTVPFLSSETRSYDPVLTDYEGPNDGGPDNPLDPILAQKRCVVMI